MAKTNAVEQESELCELSPKELTPILADHIANGEAFGVEGPPGGGKSSLAEKLKQLMEEMPFYTLKGSPVNESPLGRQVRVGNAVFEVVGTLTPQGSFLGAFSLDNQVIIPIQQLVASFWSSARSWVTNSSVPPKVSRNRSLAA